VFRITNCLRKLLNVRSPQLRKFNEITPLVASRLTDAKRVYVDGGKVVSQFFAAGPIDDVTISVIPIVLGNGIRLFSGGEGEHRRRTSAGPGEQPFMAEWHGADAVSRSAGCRGNLTEDQTGPR
jgi:dihydrofolate reductase